MGSVAIIGVTGTIGSRIASELAERDHDVLGIARRPGEGAAGVRHVAVDLTDPDAAARVLDGVESVYLTPPMAGADPLALERAVTTSVIDAARRNGVRHVVMHTALHADRGDTGARILDDKQPLEAMLADSGVPYTILRPAWFLQNLHGARSWLERGMFSMPWPSDMVWAATDVDDVARAAVAFLEGEPANRGFDVHLPGGVTAAAICRAVEEATGHGVAYQEAPGTREAVEAYPIGEAHKALYAELFDYFKAGAYLGDPLAITEVVEGFEYGTVEDFVRRELFVGVHA
jgi:uncharacterized protein YbjT (DUF2867 family)